ncbi:MAG: hypothetical protein PVG39_18450 [Desulfobacteraceae bacterium]|jgi:hypothetical protein
MNSGNGNDTGFIGATRNLCLIDGKVVGDPIINGENYAYLKIRTKVSELGANGQWADVIIDMPVVTMNPKLVATIKNYVEDGRELILNTYYKPWVDPQGHPQHAFVIVGNMTLGRKKWIPKSDAGSVPGLPT